jgi:hypothetical protein
MVRHHDATRSRQRSAMNPVQRILLVAGIGLAAIPLPLSPHLHPSTGLTWRGHHWAVTSGAMAGVAPGRPSNVFVDGHGYLHLRITVSHGRASAAELFSSDKLGFGTYQWQVQGPIGTMDPAAVLGLFPYGPQANIGRDGENELDIEFSRWGGTLCAGKCNADFTFWPATGHRALGPAEHDFHASPARVALSTERLTWTSTKVTAVVMQGLQPVGTTSEVVASWTYSPANPAARIPQVPVPLGMNLWCFNKRPARSQEVVIRDFSYSHL